MNGIGGGPRIQIFNISPLVESFGNFEDTQRS